jgi:hypothetical protein
MQSRPKPDAVIVLKGIAYDGTSDWLFAPAGWNIPEIEMQLPFSGSASTAQRRALVSLAQLRSLIDRYGDAPFVDLPGHLTLGLLLRREVMAVEILVARNQETDSAMPL